MLESIVLWQGYELRKDHWPFRHLFLISDMLGLDARQSVWSRLPWGIYQYTSDAKMGIQNSNKLRLTCAKLSWSWSLIFFNLICLPTSSGSLFFQCGMQRPESIFYPRFFFFMGIFTLAMAFKWLNTFKKHK